MELRDGNFDNILGKLVLSFTSAHRDQSVLERIDQLLDIEPLDRLDMYVSPTSAPGNAEALRRLRNGSSAVIQLPVQRRQPVSISLPSSPSNRTYQNIVAVVRNALNETEIEPRIGQHDTEAMLFGTAIDNLRKQVENYFDILTQLKAKLLQGNWPVNEFDNLPGIVSELTKEIDRLKDNLNGCENDRDDYKSSLENWKSKYDLLQQENQRLSEQVNQRDLTEHTENIDSFKGNSFFPFDEGAI